VYVGIIQVILHADCRDILALTIDKAQFLVIAARVAIVYFNFALGNCTVIVEIVDALGYNRLHFLKKCNNWVVKVNH